MTEIALHPAAPHHLPGFIAAPGETDPLMVGSVIFLIILLLVLGSTYFWLHSVPERIAHGTGKVQFQLVAVLSLLALFTHNNLFWIMALVLALVPVPDFWTPLASMAESLAKMVRHRRDRPVSELVSDPVSDSAPVTAPPTQPDDVHIVEAKAAEGQKP